MIPDTLRGVRVTDLTWAGAGPFGTKVLSDFGADVIKVESTTRIDPVRNGGPFRDRIAGVDRSGYFASRNTGKRSLVLDLKSAEGRDSVLELIRTSDVVSNNFGPGAMARLGLDYDAVRAVKPDIVYLSMPMYGETGPCSGMAGVGMTISAVTGLMWATAYRAGDPVGPGTHYPDHAANPYHAAFAVLAALRHRARTGEGVRIELSQVESTVNFLGPAVVEAMATGQEPAVLGNASDSSAPHGIFRCRGTDAWVAIAVETDDQWHAFCTVTGRAHDTALAGVAARLARAAELQRDTAAWTARLTPAEAVALLRPAGIPVAEVSSARDLVERDPQLAARGYWQRVAHPELGESLYSSPPFLLDGERVGLRRPPLLGEHSDEVLRALPGDLAALSTPAGGAA